jgi:hypothetical protein
MQRLMKSTPINRSRRVFVAGALSIPLVTLLAQCAPKPVMHIDEIRFTGMPKLPIAVDVIDIVDETPSASPGSDYSGVMATPPRTALRNWAQDRLQATKTREGVGRFRIAEALVQHSTEANKSGVSGLFSKTPQETFTIRVAAHFEIRRNDGSLVKVVTAKAWGEESFPTDLELPDRRRAVNDLVVRIMKDFDREMESSIRANMPDWVG